MLDARFSPPLLITNTIIRLLLVKGINHLLARNAWSLPRMRVFAGYMIHIDLGQAESVLLTIDKTGFVQDAYPVKSRSGKVDHPPYVKLRLEQLKAQSILECLPRDKGPKVLLEQLHIEGNAQFSTELSSIFSHLNWDMTESLSQLTGDILAVRLVEGASRFIGWQRDSARRLLEQFEEYLTYESDLFPSRRDYEDLIAKTHALQVSIRQVTDRCNQLALLEERPGHCTGSASGA